MTKPLRDVIAEALYPLIEGVANSAYNGGGYAEYEAHEESFDFADAVIAALPQTEGPEVREFAQLIVNLETRAEDLLDENHAAGRKVYVEDTMRDALIEADIDPDERLVFDLAARARQALALPVDGWRPALLDAAENVYIAWGMGWDLEGVMEVLNKALPPAPDRGGEDG